MADRRKPPKGMEGHLGAWVCGHCDSPACVDSKHLRWVCSTMCGACRGFVGQRIEVRRG